MNKKFSVLAALAAVALSAGAKTTVNKLNPTAVEVAFDGDKTALTVDFYGPNVFRVFQDPAGGILRNPVATPPAQILVDNPRRCPGEVTVAKENGATTVSTSRVKLTFPAEGKTFTVTDLQTGKTVIESLQPIDYNAKSTTVALSERPGEYFYGGGVQNGRFSHKGKVIDIVNTNSWVDGGVSSPTPYYWSTDGYGIMWHTFAPGAYDFGAKTPGQVTLSHDTPYLDIFVMVDEKPVALLNDYYQLTGNPVLLPKFGFYEGHLNAYNRDYWLETDSERGILFEDGKKYQESQKDNGGIRETLNGEVPGGYQFSARAVIDRYNAADMPLGWVLPNDGYATGYGQTSTLEGNVQNLKEFGDYARKLGVEIGLWTQSDLHPVEGVEPLLQRDIVREVRDAGVRVLKTDVAWVGAGYSFGLNGVADVAEIMQYYGNDARPFIISVDGWAGTQRHAGIWTGDQTGGQWEYIRFHIPTYIGSGLSGQPNITSDVDGIFGGKNLAVNVRDYQWKSFSPMELNMDGWGSNPKYPQALGEEAAKINRAFLKLKSQLMPYTYAAAHEAVDGKPMIRAMFLDYPSDFTHGTATKYQYMYGPSLLVAPIYQETWPDADYFDYRNNIYLPEGTWYDYFNGARYQADKGGVVINMYRTPLSKLPVFVKADAIIPMVNPNNNPSQIDYTRRIYEFWPQGTGSFTEYDDDGTTEAWRHGQFATTAITSDLNNKGVLTIAIDPTKGAFEGMPVKRSTELRINASGAPKEVAGMVGGKKMKLTAAKNMQEFEGNDAAWIYVEAAPSRISAPESAGAQIWVKLPTVNTTETAVGAVVKGFELNRPVHTPWEIAATEAPAAPALTTADDDIQPYDITLRWDGTKGDGKSVVDIEYDGMLYTDLNYSELAPEFTLDELTPETDYTFRVRARNAAGVSPWVDATYRTKSNPLEFAISGIKATASIESQPGAGLHKAFDFDERDIWHSIYQGSTVPYDITMDLGSFNTLDRLEYLPRVDAGNGTILEGTWQISENGTDWSEPVAFSWPRNADAKAINFTETTPMRYVRLHVDKALGNFGSARQIYVFKVPGSPSFIPGDINKDGKIDDNDLTSYMNYTGLRKGDGDFEYVSMGDVNRNGIIDAYDISVAATQLDGGIENPSAEIDGALEIATEKHGDEVIVSLVGKGLVNVNALSADIPYDQTEYEYIGIEPEAAAGMANLTNDRLHTAGDKVLHIVFVNLGDKPVLNGDEVIAKIRFKARKKGATMKLQQPVLVSPALTTK